MSKFYVTTPIYYVNDVPHIGHAYTTIAADVLARYHRLKGDKVFFLTGTDEHGQKVADAAAKKGMQPKAFVDSLIPSFKEAWKILDIDYDLFIRTTDDYHEKAVAEIIRRCDANGDIYLGEYEGLYCKGCEKYYLERDLVDGKCPLHLTPPTQMKEESYFFRLSKYQSKLLQYYEAHPQFLSPAFRKDEIINRVKEELKDLSVSRTSLTWGIPFPVGKGHVVYVWFDALTNYLSGIGWPSDMKKFKQFWPADVHLMAKDIAWFHQVIWPAMLMSAGIELPKKAYTHGYLTIEGQKMSKSLGNFITPQELVARFGVDAVRYFLLYQVPFGADGDFSEATLVTRVNADLADSYGNLLSRSLTLIEKNFESKWPVPASFTTLEEDIITAADALDGQVESAMDALEYHKAFDAIFNFVRQVNKYMTETQPWKEKDTKRLGTILYTILESLRVATIFLSPFIPSTAARAAQQLGQDITTLGAAKFTKATKGTVKKAEVLQKKLEVKKQDSPFAKLNLRVAHVVSASPHPDAEKLVVLRINLGNEERTLVAGLRAFYKPEELVGKHIVIVANLKPAKLRGIVSQGMLLAAEKNGVVKVLEAPTAEPGSPVTLPGVKSGTQEIAIDEALAVKMTTKLQKVMVDGVQLKSPTGDIVCDIEDGASIR